MDERPIDRRDTMPAPGGDVICPWCNLECAGIDAFKAHVMGQHADIKGINFERIEEIARWHRGETDVIDI